MSMYAYGLKERPFMIGAQPRGFLDWKEFDSKFLLPCGERVWSIVWYGAPLPAEFVRDYELVRLPDEDKEDEPI